MGGRINLGLGWGWGTPRGASTPDGGGLAPVKLFPPLHRGPLLPTAKATAESLVSAIGTFFGETGEKTLIISGGRRRWWQQVAAAAMTGGSGARHVLHPRPNDERRGNSSQRWEGRGATAAAGNETARADNGRCDGGAMAGRGGEAGIAESLVHEPSAYEDSSMVKKV